MQFFKSKIPLHDSPFCVFTEPLLIRVYELSPEEKPRLVFISCRNDGGGEVLLEKYACRCRVRLVYSIRKVLRTIAPILLYRLLSHWLRARASLRSHIHILTPNAEIYSPDADTISAGFRVDYKFALTKRQDDVPRDWQLQDCLTTQRLLESIQLIQHPTLVVLPERHRL